MDNVHVAKKEMRIIIINIGYCNTKRYKCPPNEQYKYYWIMRSIYFDFLQTSQVSIELEEKEAKVTELEEILTSKNKEVKHPNKYRKKPKNNDKWQVTF